MISVKRITIARSRSAEQSRPGRSEPLARREGHFVAVLLPNRASPTWAAGASLRNLGIHGIDAALALAGRIDADPEIVGAVLDDRLYGEAVEEYVAVTLRFADGMIAIIEAGYSYASIADGGELEWRISAANASLADRGNLSRLATLDDGAKTALEPLSPGARYRVFMADRSPGLPADCRRWSEWTIMRGPCA